MSDKKDLKNDKKKAELIERLMAAAERIDAADLKPIVKIAETLAK